MACTGIRKMSHEGLFKGDAPELVEALIQASRISVAKNALPSLVGRELVPWQDESVPHPVMHLALEDGVGKSSSAYSISKGAVDRRRSSPVKRVKTYGRARSGSPCGADESPGNKASARGASFACPALASAPRPEALPMPTTGLLSRAGVRSRSPSPSAGVEHFFRMHTQQLVGPVAA
jgi:hypothetical protein